MDIHTAMEESYKHGYAKGYADGKGDSGKRGHWIIHESVLNPGNTWAECSVCLTCGSPHWKVCPVCETKMEAMPLEDSFPEAKTINIKNVNREVKSYG